MKTFETAFASHIKTVEKNNLTKPPEQRIKARAASKFMGQGLVIWNDFSKQFFPGMVSQDPDLPCDVCHIGVQAGAVTSAAEKAWVGSWRVSTVGTRTVVAVAAHTMQECFGSMNPVKYWDKLLSFGSVAEDEFQDGASSDLFFKNLFVGTLGPKEFLWLPAGWIFAENVMAGKDLQGVMMRGVHPRNASALNELLLIQKLIKNNPPLKEDLDLNKVIEHLSNRKDTQAALALDPPPLSAPSNPPPPSEGNEAGAGEVAKKDADMAVSKNDDNCKDKDKDKDSQSQVDEEAKKNETQNSQTQETQQQPEEDNPPAAPLH